MAMDLFRVRQVPWIHKLTEHSVTAMNFLCPQNQPLPLRIIPLRSIPAQSCLAEFLILSVTSQAAVRRQNSPKLSKNL